MMLRVLTLNIRLGGAGRHDLILSVLREQRPDVIVLQEVVRSRFVEQAAQELEMQLALPNGYYRQRVAVLSRFPIRRSKGYSLFPAECNVLRSETEFGTGQSLTIFGLHLTASSHMSALEVVRLYQARYLRRLLRSSGPATILAGDLNAVARGDTVDLHRMPLRYRSLLRLQGGRYVSWAVPELEKAGFVDAFRMLHPDEPGHTLPAHDPHIRLDYILVPKRMRERIKRCEPVRTPESVRRASDHLPVMMEIELD